MGIILPSLFPNHSKFLNALSSIFSALMQTIYNVVGARQSEAKKKIYERIPLKRRLVK
jgi:hypothetical protein